MTGPEALDAHLQELFDLQAHAAHLRGQATTQDILSDHHRAKAAEARIAAADLRREADQVMADAAHIEAEWAG